MNQTCFLTTGLVWCGVWGGGSNLSVPEMLAVAKSCWFASICSFRDQSFWFQSRSAGTEILIFVAQYCLDFSLIYTKFCIPIPLTGCVFTFSSLCLTGNHINLSVFSVGRDSGAKTVALTNITYILRDCYSTVSTISRVFLSAFLVFFPGIWRMTTAFPFRMSAILTTKGKETKLALF